MSEWKQCPTHGCMVPLAPSCALCEAQDDAMLRYGAGSQKLSGNCPRQESMAVVSGGGEEKETRPRRKQ